MSNNIMPKLNVIGSFIYFFAIANTGNLQTIKPVQNWLQCLLEVEED